MAFAFLMYRKPKLLIINGREVSAITGDLKNQNLQLVGLKSCFEFARLNVQTLQIVFLRQPNLTYTS